MWGLDAKILLQNAAPELRDLTPPTEILSCLTGPHSSIKRLVLEADLISGRALPVGNVPRKLN